MPKGIQGFVKDDPNINREGANRGSKKEKAFTEYFDEICVEIAIANKMEVEDVKKVIYKVGYAKAKEGNYQFYKDILDRIHGQAKNNIDVMSGGKPIPIIQTNVSTNNSDNKDTGTDEKDTGDTGRNISEQNNLNPPILNSDGAVRQAPNADEHSVGELPTP